MNQPVNVTRSLVVLDRFPDGADGWPRLVRDVVGGGAAVSPLIAALDRSAANLLEGVDVEAALAIEPDLLHVDAPVLAEVSR